MAGLVPAIQSFIPTEGPKFMDAGTRPGMTI